MTGKFRIPTPFIKRLAEELEKNPDLESVEFEHISGWILHGKRIKKDGGIRERCDTWEFCYKGEG